MQNLEKQRPDAWRDSQLFSFIEDAWNNSLATVGNKNIIAQRLTAIDGIFQDVHSLKLTSMNELVPSLLLMRAFSAFRSSVMVGLAIPVDSYPLQRACLEGAGYARLIYTDPGLAELWIKRSEDEQARSRFTNGKVREAIKSADEKLSMVYQELYERTIEYGAHPNEKSVLTNIVRESMKTKVIQYRLLPGDGIVLDSALRSIAQVGICALKIFGTIFKRQFEEADAHNKITAAQGRP
jgi:hypothetical protein